MSSARRFSDIDVLLETQKCLRICVLRFIVASYCPILHHVFLVLIMRFSLLHLLRVRRTRL
jgi:hypothetical protein